MMKGTMVRKDIARGNTKALRLSSSARARLGLIATRAGATRDDRLVHKDDVEGDFIVIVRECCFGLKLLHLLSLRTCNDETFAMKNNAVKRSAESKLLKWPIFNYCYDLCTSDP